MSNPKLHTALHIVKGAIQKVLGASLTSGVYEDAENSKGRLVVDFDRKPDDEEVKKIQEEIDKKIAENSEIQVLEMPRKEAEEKFGNAIYDKFKVPDEIQNLKILLIENWNANACAKSHVSKTGEVDKIQITKCKFRNGKGQLEVSFIVGD